MVDIDLSTVCTIVIMAIVGIVVVISALVEWNKQDYKIRKGVE